MMWTEFNLMIIFIQRKDSVFDQAEYGTYKEEAKPKRRSYGIIRWRQANINAMVSQSICRGQTNKTGSSIWNFSARQFTELFEYEGQMLKHGAVRRDTLITYVPNYVENLSIKCCRLVRR